MTKYVRRHKDEINFCEEPVHAIKLNFNVFGTAIRRDVLAFFQEMMPSFMIRHSNYSKPYFIKKELCYGKIVGRVYFKEGGYIVVKDELNFCVFSKKDFEEIYEEFTPKEKQMTKCMKKIPITPPIVWHRDVYDAVRWLKHGDHPSNYLKMLSAEFNILTENRHFDMVSYIDCKKNGIVRLKKGDYIITDKIGRVTVVSEKEFNEEFDRLKKGGHILTDKTGCVTAVSEKELNEEFEPVKEKKPKPLFKKTTMKEKEAALSEFYREATKKTNERYQVFIDDFQAIIDESNDDAKKPKTTIKEIFNSSQDDFADSLQYFVDTATLETPKRKFKDLSIQDMKTFCDDLYEHYNKYVDDSLRKKLPLYSSCFRLDVDLDGVNLFYSDGLKNTDNRVEYKLRVFCPINNRLTTEILKVNFSIDGLLYLLDNGENDDLQFAIQSKILDALNEQFPKDISILQNLRIIGRI